MMRIGSAVTIGIAASFIVGTVSLLENAKRSDRKIIWDNKKEKFIIATIVLFVACIILAITW